PYNVERVLTNINADHGDCAVLGSLRHGVLLAFAAPSQLLSLAGREHGRTVPLAVKTSEVGCRLSPTRRPPLIGHSPSLAVHLRGRAPMQMPNHIPAQAVLLANFRCAS